MTKKSLFLSDIDMPDGWEATGEFRGVQYGEYWLDVNGIVRRMEANYGSLPRVILRRGKVLRDAVLPADAGKIASFSDTGSPCYHRSTIQGWRDQQDGFNWYDSESNRWKFCQVEDTVKDEE